MCVKISFPGTFLLSLLLFSSFLQRNFLTFSLSLSLSLSLLFHFLPSFTIFHSLLSSLSLYFPLFFLTLFFNFFLSCLLFLSFSPLSFHYQILFKSRPLKRESYPSLFLYFFSLSFISLSLSLRLLRSGVCECMYGGDKKSVLHVAGTNHDDLCSKVKKPIARSLWLMLLRRS